MGGTVEHYTALVKAPRCGQNQRLEDKVTTHFERRYRLDWLRVAYKEQVDNAKQASSLRERLEKVAQGFTAIQVDTAPVSSVFLLKVTVDIFILRIKTKNRV